MSSAVDDRILAFQAVLPLPLLPTHAAPLTPDLTSVAALPTKNNNNHNNNNNVVPYWEEPGWVPITKAGKQRSPNMIRNELQRLMDSSSESQSSFVRRMGVNNKSFRNFMNPKTYKDPWNAVQNGTYWAAAKLLEEEYYFKKQINLKRTRDGRNQLTDDARKAKRQCKKGAKDDMLNLIEHIVALEGVDEYAVYDSCSELVKKIKEFLSQDGATKKAFIDLALGGVNYNSLSRFMAAKRQDQAGNVVYRRAYAFFEKKRILENKPKSDARIKNEIAHPNGFPLECPESIYEGLTTTISWPN